MKIDIIPLGDFQANCYVVRNDSRSGHCVLIDPGLNPEPLIRFLQSKSLAPELILITHGHADHIGGVESVREYWPEVKVAISKADATMLTNPAENLSMLAEVMVQARPAEIILDSQRYVDAPLTGLRFEVIYTPGHTPGGVCYYYSPEDVLFTGDTLFAGSVGRTDLPAGNHQQLIDSILTKLLLLPAQTKIYPGHGPVSSLRVEKRYNPFLQESFDARSGL